MAGASVIPASVFASRLAPPRSPAPPAIPQGPDPHDPAFADIYAGFVEADRNAARFGSAAPEDVTFWTEQLYGEDLEAAENAARWLGQFGGSQALGPLRDALTHNDSRVRAATLLALGDLGDPAALPDLQHHLLHDAASMAREAAAQSLGRIGDRSSEQDLERAAAEDGKSKVRKAARTALAQVRARRAAAKDKENRGPS
jgi:HEAT repeat protein